MAHFFRYYVFRFGLPASFLMLLAENMGIPLPTEIVYVIAQNLILKGNYNYFFISFIFFIAHLLGSILSYMLGLRIAQGMHKTNESNSAQKKLAHYYEKYGEVTAFFARFIGQVRPWSSYVAGTAEMPFWPFLIATALGTAIFNALALKLTGSIIRFSGHHLWVSYLIGASFALGIVAMVVAHIRALEHKRKNKQTSAEL